MAASHDVPVRKPFKIRLRNSKDSLHPMQHPIHLHGAQFLVVEKNGIKTSNLAWKDTVLVPVGSYVDIVSYFPNAGEWMMHCHIAEHLSSGMMTSFRAA
jgi:FtsP/CotA-like multicopper oxidase with cupredoxin domain